MHEMAPVLELLMVPEGSGARLYVAGWCPPAVRMRLDAQRSATITTLPDAGQLAAFMWKSDAPYQRVDRVGKLEVIARGRAAVVLAEWLNGLLDGTVA
jgi:hypothetical protein